MSPKAPIDSSIPMATQLASGQAALMALEALMLTIVEKRLLAPEDIVEAIEVTIGAKLELVEDGEAKELLALAVGMLKGMANSVAAAKPKATGACLGSD
jgi:hypothetical protein